MARKYGFVNAADVKIAGVRGANAHSASFRSARATNKPLSTVSYPKTTQPGAQWAGMGHAIGLAAMSMWGSVSGSGDSGDNTDTIRGMSSGTSRGGGGRGRQPALSTSQRVGIKIGTNIGRRIRGGNAVDTPRAVETPTPLVVVVRWGHGIPCRLLGTSSGGQIPRRLSGTPRGRGRSDQIPGRLPGTAREGQRRSYGRTAGS
jgi:hypothetical protein